MSEEPVIKNVGYVLRIDQLAIEKADESIFVLQTDMILSMQQVKDLREQWDKQWEVWGLKTPRTLILTSKTYLRDLQDWELEAAGLRKIDT